MSRSGIKLGRILGRALPELESGGIFLFLLGFVATWK